MVRNIFCFEYKKTCMRVLTFKKQKSIILFVNLHDMQGKGVRFMPTNESKLKAKLVEMGFSYSDCAEQLGISTNTFTSKMKDVKKFSIPQANKLSELLKLTDEEKINIFLS